MTSIVLNRTPEKTNKLIPIEKSFITETDKSTLSFFLEKRKYFYLQPEDYNKIMSQIRTNHRIIFNHFGI